MNLGHLGEHDDWRGNGAADGADIAQRERATGEVLRTQLPGRRCRPKPLHLLFPEHRQLSSRHSGSQWSQGRRTRAISRSERHWTCLMLGTMSPAGESIATDMLWSPL
jgi:hypothetical protein